MNIKRNIIFALEARKKNGVAITENVPIRMRVNYSGQRIEFTMPYRIDVAKWDAAKQRVKNGCTNKLKVSASEINAELTRSYTLIQDIFKEFELQELMPTTEQLKDVYTSRTKVEDPKSEELIHQKTFWEIYDEFTEENGKLSNWTKATFEKFAAQRNHLQGFNPNISFDDFTEEGLNDYMDFLGNKLEMRNSTVLKQIGFLKWFLRWSMKKGFHQNAAYETFKPKLKSVPKKVIFLNQEELQKIVDFQIPDNHPALGPIRDIFLFCCYTGLRYSDVLNLTWDDVHDGKMEVVTIKTSDRLIIELNQKANALMSKYEGIHFEGNVVFPVIVNQKMNESLHLLFKLAGFNEPIKKIYYMGNQRMEEVVPKYKLISTHCGRRTFICMALSKGIPPSVVMKWTGHSDYKAMKPYIDVADETKASAMSKFDLM